MKKFIPFILIFIIQPLDGQTSFNLRMCIDSAIQNHPRSVDTELLNRINENILENYSSQWFPELSFQAQASYQSDVVEFDIESPVPGLEFPVAPKDQYKFFVDVRQTIYDAGKIKKSREKEDLSSKASILQTETDIEKIKSTVVNLYYNVLMLQESIDILQLTLGQIRENVEIVKASVESGVALESDIDLLKVQELDLLQEMRNLEQRKSSAIEMLKLITEIQLRQEANFEITHFDSINSQINRKELQLITQKQSVLEKSAELVQASRYPVAFAFGQLGYGNPGLNMLNDEFDTYYLIGVGLKWNIWDWKKTSREKSNIMYRVNMLNNQQKEFTENINRAMINQQAVINEHEGNIVKYAEILDLREDISETYEKQLRYGTIRTIDYLNVVNQEKIMRIKLNNEKILLQKAIADYNLLTGNL